MPSVAPYYHPEGYTTSGQKLTGRNAAGRIVSARARSLIDNRGWSLCGINAPYKSLCPSRLMLFAAC